MGELYFYFRLRPDNQVESLWRSIFRWMSRLSFRARRLISPFLSIDCKGVGPECQGVSNWQRIEIGSKAFTNRYQNASVVDSDRLYSHNHSLPVINKRDGIFSGGYKGMNVKQKMLCLQFGNVRCLAKQK
jgi:hypothetical protein